MILVHKARAQDRGKQLGLCGDLSLPRGLKPELPPRVKGACAGDGNGVSVPNKSQQRGEQRLWDSLGWLPWGESCRLRASLWEGTEAGPTTRPDRGAFVMRRDVHDIGRWVAIGGEFLKCLISWKLKTHCFLLGHMAHHWQSSRISGNTEMTAWSRHPTSA